MSACTTSWGVFGDGDLGVEDWAEERDRGADLRIDDLRFGDAANCAETPGGMLRGKLDATGLEGE